MTRAAQAEHGTRSKYVTGCRCSECRAANAAYGKARWLRLGRATLALPAPPARPERCPGVDGRPCPNGRSLRGDSSRAGLCAVCARTAVADRLVPADRARAHLRDLRRRGVGLQAVADASDVSPSVLLDIRQGRADKIRASTERRLLSVDEGALADGALVPAGPTLRAIDRLIREHGYDKAAIAERAGLNRRLQFLGKHVLARTAMRVRKLLREAEGADLDGPEHRKGNAMTLALRSVR